MIAQILTGTILGLFLFFVMQPALMAWGRQRQEKWRAERTWIEGKPPSEKLTLYQRAFAVIGITSIVGVVLVTAIEADWFGIAALSTLGGLSAATFVWRKFFKWT